MGFYGCLTARADTLFEVADAARCTDGPVRTLAGLALAPDTGDVAFCLTILAVARGCSAMLRARPEPDRHGGVRSMADVSKIVAALQQALDRLGAAAQNAADQAAARAQQVQQQAARTGSGASRLVWAR
jgi:hypothetical protein